MLSHEAIIHDFYECRLLCGKCPVCKETPDIHYEPGATITACQCGVFDVLPDWEPRAAMRIWNACVMIGRMDELTKTNERKRIYENSYTKDRPDTRESTVKALR